MSGTWGRSGGDVFFSFFESLSCVYEVEWLDFEVWYRGKCLFLIRTELISKWKF